MIRTLDPEPFLCIAEHPEVAPWILGPLNPDVVRNPQNFSFLSDSLECAYIYIYLQPGLYAVHTMALPAARGSQMQNLMREVQAFMFLETDAVEIVTQAPRNNKGARQLAELAGFRHMFWGDSSSYQSLRYEDWVRPDFSASAWKDVTIAGIHHGNIIKAVGLYNRHAIQCGRPAWTILSVNPPVCATGDAVVSFAHGETHDLSAALQPEGLPIAVREPSCQLVSPAPLQAE